MLKSIVKGAEHDIVRIPMKGKNLCPNTGWMSGQYRDGVWETTNTRSTSDFFPVSSNQYRLKINAGQLISFINFNYFDNQKKWLGNRTTLGMSTFLPTEQNIVIPQLPSNAMYMRITIRFYNDNGNPPIPQSFIDDSNIMVSEVTSEQPYEPYGYQNGWEIRDNQDRLIWGREDEFQTTTGSLLFKGYGLPVKVKSLLGNAVQNGTPTPDTPIMPEFVGVRTSQIIDYTLSESGGIDTSGNPVIASNLWRANIFYEIHGDIALSFVRYSTLLAVRVNYYDADYTHISREQINVGSASGVSLTIPANAKYFKWTLYASSGSTIDIDFVRQCYIMFNTGSTAIPYEPYGWAIEIEVI